ncbi:nucleotidyltransferase family protein [Sporolactobacillus shoreae]|uniref:Nucleotidyltransferase family protein n=1 Tax=Sporolactobacillus shoreae TaxID=1465501 RepID=A0A4Z0GRG6_9BACL|nr:nucleotidyltransferase family protein [Sporolactobacillus shoreae]TGA99909.1 nucleotidyltransferase family protein [Sporolactobacillus shoreae]
MVSDRSAKIYGIVLASGFSRRMGRQKLLLHWNNAPLLGHVLETASQSLLSGVIAVLPENDSKRLNVALRFRCDVVKNINPEQGLGSSLAAGIRSISDEADAAVVLLGDQPQIKQEDINSAVLFFNSRFNSEDTSAKVIMQTRYADGRKGHPTLFSKPFFDDLSQLNGDIGARWIIKANGPFVACINSDSPYPPDIDTPADYRQLLNECNGKKV